MLLFIIIFFAMVIVVGATAVLGFSFYLRRKTKSLKSKNQRQFADAPPFRSLFEPDETEIRALEQEESAETAAKSAEEKRLSAEGKVEDVRDFQKIWANEPDKLNTVNLLRLAAHSGNAEIFSETAERITEFWRENKIANLTAKDLADLLDSHLRILPQQERISGAIFWIKREIISLRGNSE